MSDDVPGYPMCCTTVVPQWRRTVPGESSKMFVLSVMICSVDKFLTSTGTHL